MSSERSVDVLVVSRSTTPDRSFISLLGALARQGMGVLILVGSGSPVPVVADTRVIVPPRGALRGMFRAARALLMMTVRRPGATVALIQAVFGRRAFAKSVRALVRTAPIAAMPVDMILYASVRDALDFAGWMAERCSVVYVGEDADLNVEYGAALARASAVLCASERIRSELRSRGLGEERLIVLRPAVDPHPTRTTADEGVDGLRILTAGRIDWWGGLEYVLSAVHLLDDEGVDVRYHIAGDGPEADRVRFTVRDLGLDRHVSLSPDVREAPSAFAKADVFIAPALTRGLTVELLEAMAHELPVIALEDSDAELAVRDGVEGAIVARRDPAAIAAAVRRFQTDAAARRAAGTAARVRVESRFSIADRAQQLSDVLSELVVKHRRA